MSVETILPGDGRRAELGDFLRRRRAELSTDVVGLPQTRRRRTPGLRREEVAELANISTALYSWLEQGRDVPISRRTIDAVASALKLAPTEREHIHTLVSPPRSDVHEEVSARLEHMVSALRMQPCFVVNHKWDVMLLNRVAHVVFKHEDDEGLLRLNLLESVFGEHGRRLFINWHDVARSVVELFRYDYAAYATEPDTHALVETLRATNAEFAAIWEEHRVRRALEPGALSRVNSAFGEVALESTMFAVVEAPGLRCIIFTAADSVSEQRIDELVRCSCAELDNPDAGATIRLR
jgi:transcriptional regulator with XRE-family HTH domain